MGNNEEEQKESEVKNLESILNYCTYSFNVKPVSTALPTLQLTGFQVHHYVALQDKAKPLQKVFQAF